MSNSSLLWDRWTMLPFAYVIVRIHLHDEREHPSFGTLNTWLQWWKYKRGEPLKYYIITDNEVTDLWLQSRIRFCTAVSVDSSFCPVIRCLSTTTCTASGSLPVDMLRTIWRSLICNWNDYGAFKNCLCSIPRLSQDYKVRIQFEFIRTASSPCSSNVCHHFTYITTYLGGSTLAIYHAWYVACWVHLPNF